MACEVVDRLPAPGSYVSRPCSTTFLHSDAVHELSTQLVLLDTVLMQPLQSQNTTAFKDSLIVFSASTRMEMTSLENYTD